MKLSLTKGTGPVRALEIGDVRYTGGDFLRWMRIRVRACSLEFSDVAAGSLSYVVLHTHKIVLSSVHRE